MREIVIYGAGGLGRQVLDILQQGGRYSVAAFLDSDPRKHGAIVDDVPVLGGPEAVPQLLARGVTAGIVAIGDNVARAANAATLRERGMELISAVHPLASISPSAELGEHVVIDARATVCVHARIGAHTILCAGAIAEHDNELGSAVFLGPAVRLAGTVRVEDFAHLEIGASVIPGRRVGKGARIKAGAVVIQDVPAGATVSGVPALVQATFRSRFVSQEAGAGVVG